MPNWRRRSWVSLKYIFDAQRQEGGREVVFVPVAMNYDRLLEDQVLIAAQTNGARASSASSCAAPCGAR